MTKTFDKSGVVIFSNSVEYEFDILSKYFKSDLYPKNIIFVYSKKDPISSAYTDRLR